MGYDLDADPQELRRMATSLRIFSDDMDDAVRRLTHLFETIDWDDARYQRFRGDMVPVLSMLADTAKVAGEAMRHCDGKAEIVERYLAGGG